MKSSAPNCEESWSMVLVNGKKGLVDVRHSHNRIRLPEKKILLTMYLCNRLNTYLGAS